MTQHFQGPLGTADLVLQVRRVDQDELIVLHGQLDLSLEDLLFILGRLVKADLADAQHVGLLEELRHVLEHFVAEWRILGFLGIHTHPAEMPDAVLRGPSRFELRDLAKVVDERLGVGSIKAGPKAGSATATTPDIAIFS